MTVFQSFKSIRKAHIAVWLTVFLLGKATLVLAATEEQSNFSKLGKEFEGSVFPLMQKYCLDCHSNEKQKGELDLEQFRKLDDVRRHPMVWVKVVEMIEDEEMPPKKKPQFSTRERKVFLGWVDNYLDAEALANAGDPGRVVIRRLSNAEYTYTIQDLTGIALEPVKEFPVDGAAGEGFMNVGDAMGMSPALVQKYLDAAKEVAAHAVLTPKGIRFSLGTSRRDWADELLFEIRTIYARHTSGPAATDKVYRWDPAALDKAMKMDGRVDLFHYLHALVENRDRLMENPALASEVAREKNLNAKYLRRMTDVLADGNPSLLLRKIRDDLRTAEPTDVSARIVWDVRKWKENLWRFDKVGQIGRIGGSTAWMNAINPLNTSRELKLKLPADAKGEISVFLAAGDAGDGTTGDVVRWVRPQLVMKGQPNIPLAAARGLPQSVALLQLNELGRTGKYLAVIATAERTGKTIEETSLGQNLNPRVLANWVAAVQLGKFASPQVMGHYPGKMFKVGDYEAIRGWGVPATPSLIASKAEQTIRFGTLTIPGRSVNMHPSPTTEAMLMWQSPLDGRVKLKGFFADSDGVCGNGVAWRVEMVNRTGASQLASGAFDNGKRSEFAPEMALAVQKGDYIKFVVNARAGSHVCDTTQVSFTITEQDGKKRAWNLEREVVDRIHDGNPLADSFGNPAVWHFCSSANAKPAQSNIPPGSALAKWRAGVIGKVKPVEAQKLAAAVQRALLPKEEDVADADKRLRDIYTSSTGPLKWLESALGEVKLTDVEAVAPSVIEYKLPGELVAGGEVVVTVELHPDEISVP